MLNDHLFNHLVTLNYILVWPNHAYVSNPELPLWAPHLPYCIRYGMNQLSGTLPPRLKLSFNVSTFVFHHNTRSLAWNAYWMRHPLVVQFAFMHCWCACLHSQLHNTHELFHSWLGDPNTKELGFSLLTSIEERGMWLQIPTARSTILAKCLGSSAHLPICCKRFKTVWLNYSMNPIDALW